MKVKFEPNGKMTKGELDSIARALRANVKAAKATIVALGPKLKAEFEVQLSVSYPPEGDPVWQEALNTVYKAYKVQQARVEARCAELRIPKRFRPHMNPPGWSDSWRCSCFDFKDLRAEMRRLAGIQIDDMLKSRLACITEAAQDFLKRLPASESMVPPIKVSDIEALIEGRTVSKLTVADAEENLQLGDE